MPLAIRPACVEDARAVAGVHAQAVHGLAGGHYSADILRAWSPEVPGEDWIDGFRRSHEEGARIVAELDDKVVGFAELVAENQELRACYIHPDAARQGIGRDLVERMEAMARDAGLASLWLDSSLNAEPFYRSLGYRVVERGTHLLDRRAGAYPMACVKMCKDLFAAGQGTPVCL